MTYYPLLCACVLGVTLLSAMVPSGVADQPREVVDIGSRKQLFIDDHVVESFDGLRRRLGQPKKHPANPLLPMVPADSPGWEADMPIQCASVLFDVEKRLFKLWYGLWERGQSDSASALAYATSNDGIHWTKPNLGLYTYRGTRENNVVWAPSGEACCVFKDPHEADPARRYKMLYQAHGRRTCAAYSADGLRWTPYNDGKPVIPDGRDTQNIAYWDPELERYVAIVRERTGKLAEIRPEIVQDAALRQSYRRLWGQWPDKKTLRRVGQAESRDFENWTPVRVVLEADSRDPPLRGEFYNMEVMKYHGLRIGLVTVFTYDKQRPRGQVQLAFSRDGMHWHRAGGRDVFLPNSDRPGAFDWGSVYPTQGPVVVGDEIWIYYTGDGYDHSYQPPSGVEQLHNGIGLATLRLDGFVAVEPTDNEGTLTTCPLTFSGRRLVVNADARDGSVLVEVLGADGRPIPDLSGERCVPLTSDKIDHVVRWNPDVDLRKLQGEPIRLRFRLQGAMLYSFAFRE